MQSSCWVNMAFWLIQIIFYVRRLIKSIRQRQQNTYQDPFTTDDAFDVFNWMAACQCFVFSTFAFQTYQYICIQSVPRQKVLWKIPVIHLVVSCFQQVTYRQIKATLLCCSLSKLVLLSDGAILCLSHRNWHQLKARWLFEVELISQNSFV